MENTPLSIYLHVPFCVKKCPYCDFNTYASMGHLVNEYIPCVCTEIARCEERGRPVATVYFGGGTPTFLPAEGLAAILNTVQQTFDILPDAEISAEANPNSSDVKKFQAMRRAGFNRLSIGVQALEDRLLRVIGRQHSAEEAECAVRMARQAGFTNVSIDLMFGLPTQTRADWDTTLERALALKTEHISLYALTLEPGTRFERLHKDGKLLLPPEEDEAWMYERAIEVLTQAGFEHYEISNFARSGFRARHNLVYWHNEEYLGFGPGAVSYLRGRRWTKEKLPPQYIAKVRAGEDLAIDGECLEPEAAIGETLMLGLRLLEGVSLSRLRARYPMIDLEARFGLAFARLTQAGLLEREGEWIRLTHRGLLFANDVFVELL